MKKISRYLTAGNIFLLLGILLIFFISFSPPTDPDLGWHLQDGNYLIHNNFQVAHHDIFSYTMPDFPLIMHEWVTDIWMFFLYNHFGLLPLSVIFALITTLAFIAASFGVPARREYKIIAAILATIASIPVIGVRPQMLNLLALAIVIYMIFRFRKDPASRIIFWLPPFFILWVNMHGGFAVGLFFVGLFLAVELGKHFSVFLLKRIAGFKRQKFGFRHIKQASTFLVDSLRQSVLPAYSLFRLGGVLVVSGLATLVNPYGWHVYIEVFTTIFDKYTKSIINEWLPVTPANPMSHEFLIYLALLVILLLFSWRKNDYTYLLIAGVFLWLGFTSWRHMPLFLIVSTPLWVGIVESLVGKELLVVASRKWLLALMLIAVILVARQQAKDVVPKTLSIDKMAEGNYPLGAVRWLKANPIEGRMFNEYNWGGFLIWQYPEKQVFLDGRMPSWKIGDYRAFEEFNNTMQFGKDWDKTMDKWNINFALIYNNIPNQIMFKQLGWEVAYGDGLSLVMKRKAVL